MSWPDPLLDVAKDLEGLHGFEVCPVPHAVAGVIAAGAEGGDVGAGDWIGGHGGELTLGGDGIHDWRREVPSIFLSVR